MRLVLDTNIVLSGLLWNGSRRHLLDDAHLQLIDIYTSQILLLELAGVLARPKFKAKILASGFRVDQLICNYAALAIPVLPPTIPPTSPDPDDDLVLATALAAKPTSSSPGDHHLLSLSSFHNFPIRNTSQTLTQLQVSS